MKADEAAAKSDSLSEAGSLDASAKANIFDDLHPEGFEATDLKVG